MAQATLYHTGAGSNVAWSPYYNGAAGTTERPGDSPEGIASWAMQPLPDVADEIVQMVAKLSGYVEPEGGSTAANIYWNPGNGFLEDATSAWEPTSFGPAVEKSSAALTSSLPTPAQWNADGEVGIRSLVSSERADRAGRWSVPTCVIDYYVDDSLQLVMMLGWLAPVLGPLATLLPREWGAVRGLLARGIRGRGQHRFTADEWARLVRAARESKGPRRFVLA